MQGVAVSSGTVLTAAVRPSHIEGVVASGEWPGLFPEFMEAGGGHVLDAITWHHYPTQSRRCGLRPEPTERASFLDPDVLDNVNVWAEAIEAIRDARAPGMPIWVSESSNAQCVGESGVDGRGTCEVAAMNHLARP